MTHTPKQDPSRNLRGCLLVIGLVIGAILFIRIVTSIQDSRTATRVQSSSETTTSTIVRSQSTAVPRAATFREIRNSCGACGTDSPVGGWESNNGRSLILSSNGNFVAYYENGTSLAGEWEQTGRQLCLSLDIGSRSCLRYEQKVDAMKLDDAIYIRR